MNSNIESASIENAQSGHQAIRGNPSVNSEQLTPIRNSAAPTVSVIAIARSPDEFQGLEKALASQTYQDFELVAVAGGTIPEAWNKAIQSSRGEILVFTETDAAPLNNLWLQELVEMVKDEMTVVKGLEVTGFPWDLSNVAAHRSVFVKNQFDSSFKWAEDTELFSRLKLEGYALLQIQQAAVVHPQKYASKRMIRRALRYGIYWSRIRHQYPDPVDVSGFSQVGKILLMSVLNLIGLGIGMVVYLPERMKRK